MKITFKNLYQIIFSWIIWIIIFLIGFYGVKISLKDSLTISSVVLICLIFLIILTKYGLWSGIIIKWKNFQTKNQIKENLKEKITTEQYQAEIKQRSILFWLITLIIHAIILVIIFTTL